VPGPVALIGSGEYLPGMLDVEAALLEGRPPRFVQIPTAAGTEGQVVLDRWVRLGAEQADRLGVEAVPVVARNRDEANDPALAALVAGAGLVYLSGGHPAYLVATLRGTLLLDAILAAWQEGAALAGCSAGAMALTTWAPSTRVWERNGDPGLDVIPNLRVLPHFDKHAGRAPALVLRQFARAADGVVTVGIEEQTALVQERETRWRVMGQRAVWLIGRDGRRTSFGPGEAVDLPP
jgi:cyanophycinase-like exopeptidase